MFDFYAHLFPMDDIDPDRQAVNIRELLVTPALQPAPVQLQLWRIFFFVLVLLMVVVTCLAQFLGKQSLESVPEPIQ